MTGESVVAGAAALGLVVGASTGDSTGAGGVEVGGFGEDTGAPGDEAGADGALAELYPETEQPDFATSATGQVTTSQSTLLVSACGFSENGRV